MAAQISQEISELLKENMGYKFNGWLMNSAVDDIKRIYISVLGDDPTVTIYSNNLFYALLSFYRFNQDLYLAEYSTFVDSIIKLQVTS